VRRGFRRGLLRPGWARCDAVLAAGLVRPAIVGASGCWVVAGAVARAGTERRLGMCWRGRVGAGADERGSGRLVAGERCGVLMLGGDGTGPGGLL